jgi:hypothetical protein
VSIKFYFVHPALKKFSTMASSAAPLFSVKFLDKLASAPNLESNDVWPFLNSKICESSKQFIFLTAICTDRR